MSYFLVVLASAITVGLLRSWSLGRVAPAPLTVPRALPGGASLGSARPCPEAGASPCGEEQRAA